MAESFGKNMLERLATSRIVTDRPQFICLMNYGPGVQTGRTLGREPLQRVSFKEPLSQN